MKGCWLRLGTLVLYLSLISPGVASAQQGVGVVTALKGKAQLTRSGTQTALRFKNDLILRDIIDTQEKSRARILFGGKSTVTVRELSRLEVSEETLPTGATRSIHELSSGSILVNVARSLLCPGDEVQIRTPNATAAVPGSTIFAQYIVELARSIFICITGSCIVIPQGLPPITLASNISVNVTGDPATGLQVAEGTITQREANEILRESEIELAIKEEANQKQTAQAQTEQAAQVAAGAAEAIEAITGVAAVEEKARLDLQPEIPSPPRIFPGGDPKVLNPPAVIIRRTDPSCLR